MSGWEVSTILLAWVVVAAPAWWLIWGRRRHPQHTCEVVVHCRDEASFGGVELRSDSGGILLGAPRSLPDEGPPVPMVVDLRIPAANVRAVQIVPASEASMGLPQPRPDRPDTVWPERAVGFRTERQARRRA